MTLDNPKTHTPLIPFFLVFCVFLPLAGALSSYYALRGLQLGVFLVLGLIVFGTVVRLGSTRVEDRMFPILIWSVSLSLLLSYASVSQYLSGWDIQREFAIFQAVSRTGVWNAGVMSFYNSAISVSILPVIIQAVSGLRSEQVFKFVYPLLLSMVPVVLYKVFRQVLSPKSAFLSCYLFMSYWPFYMEVNSIGKMMIAEPLLVLLFWVSISGTNVKRSGAGVALLLSAGLIVSHYSTTYIWIAFLAFSVVASLVTRRVVAVFASTTMVLLGVMAFAWYMIVAGGEALTMLQRFVSMVVQGVVQDFFDPATRPLVALQAAGLSSSTPGLLHDLYRLTNYIVQFCILAGFVVFARKKNKSVAEKKMLPLVTVALVFLGSAVILPLFGGIPFPRIYHISLLLTSVCFVIGAELLESWWRRAHTTLSQHLAVFQLPFSSRGKMIVPATILLSYFLFTSGWVWAVSSDRPTSFVFDGSRMAEYPDNERKVSYHSEFDAPTDVDGALWLRGYGVWLRGYGRLCSDFNSQYHVLSAYGEFEPYGELNSTRLGECDLRKSYIFLSELNMVHGIGVGVTVPYASFLYQVSTDLFDHESNRLCSNGGAAIYAGVSVA